MRHSPPNTCRNTCRKVSSRFEPAKVSRNPALLKPSCSSRPSTPTTAAFAEIMVQATRLCDLTSSRISGQRARIAATSPAGADADAGAGAGAGVDGAAFGALDAACGGAACGRPVGAEAVAGEADSRHGAAPSVEDAGAAAGADAAGIDPPTS